MEKEYHLWLYKPEESSETIVSDYINTCALIRGDVQKIHSHCSVLFTTSLLDLGYRLFVHFPNGTEYEVKYGEETPGGRLVRPGLNLEKLVYAGEFGTIE